MHLVLQRLNIESKSMVQNKNNWNENNLRFYLSGFPTFTQFHIYTMYIRVLGILTCLDGLVLRSKQFLLSDELSRG